MIRWKHDGKMSRLSSETYHKRLDLRLKKLFLVMMIWSNTSIPMMFPASTIRRVSFISSSDGSRSSEGWLCTRITDAALPWIASLKTSLGWTRLAFNVPTEIGIIPVTLFRVLRRTSLKCSFALSWIVARIALTNVWGLLTVCGGMSCSRSCRFACSKAAFIWAAFN